MDAQLIGPDPPWCQILAGYCSEWAKMCLCAVVESSLVLDNKPDPFSGGVLLGSESVGCAKDGWLRISLSY